MAEQLLKLENIYKNFGNVKVLKDVNITINKVEVVALIGDNGAGKSTLIKVITGVHRPNSGKIFFKESEVEIKSVSQSRKMGIEVHKSQFKRLGVVGDWDNYYSTISIRPTSSAVTKASITGIWNSGKFL